MKAREKVKVGEVWIHMQDGDVPFVELIVGFNKVSSDIGTKPMVFRIDVAGNVTHDQIDSDIKEEWVNTGMELATTMQDLLQTIVDVKREEKEHE